MNSLRTLTDGRKGRDEGRDDEQRQECPPPAPSRHADGLCRTRERRSRRARATIGVAAAVAALAAAATLPGCDRPAALAGRGRLRPRLLESTPAGVVEHVARTESTPPGWYLLAWIGREAGISIEGLRFLSVALAAALAGLTVVYARRFLPLWIAGIAGV